LNLIKKIPSLEKISPVYAVVVAMVYSWSLLRFFWKLPSWINYSSVGEITVFFAYMIVINLIESILVCFAPILLSIVLPQKWFYDRFVTKGTLLVAMGLSYFMYFDNHLHYQKPFPLDLVYITPLIIVAIIVLVFLIDWVGILDTILKEITSRLTVFLYISIPVSLISLLTVLVRNIF
jgi:hypothetical protein